MDVIADVKCYHCGHVSGQVVGPKNAPLRPRNFIPRPGYVGELPRAGMRLRCERCRGPVFLEDVSPLSLDIVVRPNSLPRAA
jgi:DNA-directed RNA polymerase subunit RPC12/RpoP